MPEKRKEQERLKKNFNDKKETFKRQITQSLKRNMTIKGSFNKMKKNK